MRPLIVGNWKMNTTLTEAAILASGVKEGIVSFPGVEVVLCPPFPWLTAVADAVHRRPAPNLSLGAQNISWQIEGAYTGEVSVKMLQGLVGYVIIGHSERRHYFHETDDEIVKKVKLALAHGIRPIVCVGELKKPAAAILADPTELTASQLRKPLAEVEALVDGLTSAERRQLIVAYEPVWAIGTAEAATGYYANAVAEMLQEEAGFELPILYGGSVKAGNAREFLHQSNISGLLVGGASLKISEFVKICQAAA